MTLTIILFLTMGWLPIFMYFMLSNETKFKKNIVVGVTFPKEAHGDEEINLRLKKFKRQLRIVCLLLLVVVIPFVFIEDFNISISIWLLWLDFVIVLPYIPYILCNKDLKKIKVKRGWKKSKEVITTIDTKAIKASRWVSPVVFIIPFLLSLIPIIFDQTLWMAYLIDGLTIIIFWLSYRYLYRNKSEIVDLNVNLTKTLTQVRRHNWGVFWLISAYSMVLFNIGLLLSKYSSILMLATIIITTLIIVIAAFRIEFKTRKVQELLTKNSGDDFYIDEDDNWIGGVVYYNPNDTKLIINNRIGINSTFNLAKTSGKVIGLILVLILIAMPFTGVILGGMENKPIGLEIVDNIVISTNGPTKYEIPLEDIVEVELIDKLPEKLVRTWGTGMENLLKGNFSSPSTGNMKLCLDPNVAPFIFITMKNGDKYMFGVRDKDETEKIYLKLASYMK